ncbi:MAG: C39 family peptidase [Candidatus Promineifilaceae bacterium]
MHKRRCFLFPLIVLVFTTAFVWQLPAVLKAIPSRYVARLPQPLQQLGEREHVEVLPTAAPLANAASLLENTFQPTASAESTALQPPAISSSTPQDNGAKVVLDSTTVPTKTPAPTPTKTPIPIPPSARLEGFQHQFQTWNNCGPATIAMSLSYFELYLDQEQAAAVLKPNPEDRNVSPYQMAAYVNDETAYAAIERTNGTLDTVKRLVGGGSPVIIELGIEPPGEYRWLGWYGHYLLIVAYDDASQQFWVYDSWFGTSEAPMENANPEGLVLSYIDADYQWRQFNRNYIVLYAPDRAAEVANIIGSDMDDDVMWQNSLVRVQAELRQEPENAFLWFNLGTVFNALGDYERAAAAFDQARAIGLPWRMLWYQFGLYEAYYQVGRYEDVILLADVTLQDRPYFEESFYYKGMALAVLGDLSLARINLKDAVDFNPNYHPAVEALLQLNT